MILDRGKTRDLYRKLAGIYDGLLWLYRPFGVRKRGRRGVLDGGEGGTVSGESIQVELSVLLPDVPDDRDACVPRLMLGLRDLGEVLDVHVVRTSEAEAEVCIHYAPIVSACGK